MTAFLQVPRLDDTRYREAYFHRALGPLQEV